jgi:hypothetical protein
MGKYLVIHKKDFQRYKVNRVRTNIVLIIGYVSQHKDEEWVVNIVATSSKMKDLIKFIKAAKEKNAEHIKIMERLEKQNTIYSKG